MKRQEKMITKRIGRPATGKGQLIGVRLQPNDLATLDAYAWDEALTRPQAIRSILSDWLRTHSYGPHSGSKPTGPATEIVEQMDAAIEEHRRTQKSEK